MKKVAILYIGTGRYTIFWKNFITRARKICSKIVKNIISSLPTATNLSPMKRLLLFRRKT